MADSDRNCSKMEPVRAPSALRIPISLVRSVTDTSMVSHDTDAAYQQGNGSHQHDKCSDHAQNVVDLVNLIRSALGHVNTLSLALVPGLQKPQGIGERPAGNPLHSGT